MQDKATNTDRTYHSLVEAQNALIRNTAMMEERLATCKHDKGVRIHKGEEVCVWCAICPIPEKARN